MVSLPSHSFRTGDTVTIFSYKSEKNKKHGKSDCASDAVVSIDGSISRVEECRLVVVLNHDEDMPDEFGQERYRLYSIHHRQCSFHAVETKRLMTSILSE